VASTAKVEYWIPVIATVDLEEGTVTEVDQWPDELGSCWPSVTVDGDQPPTHVQDQALAIAENAEWPERNTH